MMTTGFGRRVTEPRRPDLVLIPGAPADAPMPVAGLAVLGELKERIRTVLMTRIDPTVAGRIPRAALRGEIANLVSEIATEQRVQLNKLEEVALAADLSDDMVGLGPLEPFLDDDEITDILVNGPFDIYVERRGKLAKTAARFRDTEHLVNIAHRIATAIGRRIDEASPMVDARLADGSRVNIVLPPLVLNGGTISIRKFPHQSLTLDAMVRQENLSHDVAHVLEIAARSRLNILISGGTGSGKTTLLNAVSQSIDRDERVITVEDAVELRLQQPHVVQMETRPPNIEGVGHVTLRELVRNALRMRPDRIIVGEVRGPEAFDMLQAMNTGHDGSMSTVHANSPRDALYRVENMVMMANLNLPLKAIRMHVASALNLVVHVERMRDGIRRVQSVVEIAGMEGDIITARELFAFQYWGEGHDGRIEGTFESTRMRPDFVARAARLGLEKELLEALDIEGLELSNQILLAVLSSTVLLGAALFRALRTERRRASIEPRLKAIAKVTANEDRPAVSLRRPLPRRRALPTVLSARLEAALAATGNRIGPLHLGAAGVIASSMTGLVAAVMQLRPTLTIACVGVAAAGAPVQLLQLAQARYQRQFVDVFPDALDLIVRAVRAGLPALEAIEVATREIRPPVGTEFQRMIDEMRIGIEMEDALQHAADRIRVADFRFFVVSLLLQRQTGGGIAEILANLSTIIRQRRGLRLKARALTAEATASAAVVASTPFVAGVGLFLINRELISVLFVDPRGRFMLGLAVVGLVFGVAVMNAMIRKSLR